MQRRPLGRVRVEATEEGSLGRGEGDVEEAVAELVQEDLPAEVAQLTAVVEKLDDRPVVHGEIWD